MSKPPPSPPPPPPSRYAQMHPPRDERLITVHIPVYTWIMPYLLGVGCGMLASAALFT